MGELIRREFKSPGDVEQVKDWTSSDFFPIFFSDMSAVSGSRIGLQIVWDLTNETTCPRPC